MGFYMDAFQTTPVNPEEKSFRVVSGLLFYAIYP